jgi:hypothetical protein
MGGFVVDEIIRYEISKKKLQNSVILAMGSPTLSPRDPKPVKLSYT